MNAGLIIVLLSISAVAFFFGLALGFFEVPFTKAWNEKRQIERSNERLQTLYHQRAYLYTQYEGDYMIFANCLLGAINTVASKSVVVKNSDITAIIPPQIETRILKQGKSYGFFYLLNICPPTGKIIDGRFQQGDISKINLDQIKRDLNTHLPAYLQGTGYTYQTLDVYMDESKIFHLRIGGVDYAPVSPARPPIVI